MSKHDPVPLLSFVKEQLEAQMVIQDSSMFLSRQLSHYSKLDILGEVQ